MKTGAKDQSENRNPAHDFMSDRKELKTVIHTSNIHLAIALQIVNN